MLTRLAGGHVIDPVNDRDGSEDIWIRDGRIVAPPREPRPDTTYDISGKIVMAGGIDIHSHIAGANVYTARLLLPEYHHAAQRRPEMSSLADAGWTTSATGQL
ncbi:MAG: formylmethanofuran dehydrogenase subunit A, partial [Xanthobacteraceae bacterium]|nr:formylmethanofuran dehydrogenase subunit A [Xanthobacteraceae bacterium]